MCLEFFLSDQFERYLLHERRLSAHTVRAYLQDLADFSALLERRGINEAAVVDTGVVRAWVADSAGRELSPRSMHRRLSGLRAWYRWMNQVRGAGLQDPLQALFPPKKGKTLVPVNDSASLAALLESFDEATADIRLQWLPVVSIFLTGMRVSELCAFRIADWDRSAGQFRILGKGGKQRLVPVHPWLSRHLEALSGWNQRSIDSPLFLRPDGTACYPRYMHRLVKAVMTELEARGRLSPHTLRHSFATGLLDEGADLLAVKELLGHSSLSATQVYTRTSLEKLRQLHKLLHPRSE
jgi:integrase/recombinase XerC